MDIVKAIEKEQEYLSYRRNGEEPFHLVDAIKECGFDSLEDYFTAKRNYQFAKLNFDYAEVDPSEAIAEIFRMMESQETKVLFVPSVRTFVFSGESKPYDEEYCAEHNIPVYPLYTKGGAIVSTAGDFSVVICMPDSVCSEVDYILEGMKKLMRPFMPAVEVVGNDLIVDGGKICGSVGYRQNGMFCFAAHFSFKDNSELIEKICNISGSIKTPTVIRGLTVPMFKQELREWLRV